MWSKWTYEGTTIDRRRYWCQQYRQGNHIMIWNFDGLIIDQIYITYLLPADIFWQLQYCYKDGHTALHIASFNEYLDIVRVILSTNSFQLRSRDYVSICRWNNSTDCFYLIYLIFSMNIFNHYSGLDLCYIWSRSVVMR